MKHLSRPVLLALLGVTCGFGRAQSTRFHSELLMGPYLFISHIPYDAVLMKGARLGLESEHGVSLSAAYLVGQQEDENGNYGLTHHAAVEAAVFLKPAGATFRPYGMLGSGFLEFKSFSKDKYGIAHHAALGGNFRISNQLSALLEVRYLNMAQLKLGGVHQLVVAWGLKVGF